MTAKLWSIVLAAGAGRRLLSTTGGVPKQFWRPGGAASLLEQTLYRIGPLSPPAQTLVVIDESHRGHLERVVIPSGVRVLYQPADRGTAVGILLPLVEVLRADPDAAVLLTPADHGVTRPSLFRTAVRAAHASGDCDANRIVLFGVQPDCAATDYGWIAAGRPDGPRLRPVVRFFEKPPAHTARQLMRVGAVWNTMVLMSRARVLAELFQQRAPHLWSAFETALTLDDDGRRDHYAGTYPELRRTDFSHDVVAGAPGCWLSVFDSRMGWSDLGTPERVRDWFPRHVWAPAS